MSWDEVEYCGVVVQTERTHAWLIDIDGQPYWVPKSQIRDGSCLEDGLLIVTRWWSERRHPAGSVTHTTTHDDDFRVPMIQATKEQRAIIDSAVTKVRMIANDSDMPEGRALELICADFLAGN